MKRIYKISLWFLVGALVVALMWYVLQPGVILLFTAGWLVLIALLLWIGNRQLTIRLDPILPWSKYGNWRFFVQLVLGILYLLFLINLIYYGIKISLTNTPPTWEQMIVVNLWGTVIFIPVFSLYFSLHFLKHWRTSELEAVRNQRESMRSQLDSLKNHLDPHFLFNNLNILASLIDKDKEASKTFIQKFADVYRSLLRTKSDDLILLSEELELIESYMYLVRTRFGNLIQLTINISTAKNKMVPPLTVQMLLENAIKHNLLTETRPLQIDLTQTDSHLIVRNNLYARNEDILQEGSGLKNIQQRYAHFTSQLVNIVRSETHFEVHIPLLEIETV